MPALPLDKKAFNGTVSYLNNWNTSEQNFATYICGGYIPTILPKLS